MSASPHDEPIFGLLELDEAGTVLYYKSEKPEDAIASSPPDILGENFFTDVAPPAARTELKERLVNFRYSRIPATSFDYTFNSEHGLIPVRVLLARIRDRSECKDGRNSERTLVQMRKA